MAQAAEIKNATVRLQKPTSTIIGHSNLKTKEDVYLKFLSPEDADRVRFEASD